MDVNKFEDVVANHPAGAALARLFPSPESQPPAEFAPTGLTKKDYLSLIAGNVDFWKQHLSPEGALLDPYEKDDKHPNGQEKQYATPAFALASAELVKEAGRNDLLEPSVRAFSFALTALQKGTTANLHADFYIPMLVHAHRILRTRVPADTAKKWEAQFKSLVPEETYRDVGGGGNWNLVNVTGEAMRRNDKLVATTQMAPQQEYLDKMLARQQAHFGRFGMYEDANYPLAYDAFPRMWVEDMLSDGAYDGQDRGEIEKILSLGSFSSLLLFSPQGEWAGGGRSAQHQWNEAECALIGECNAARWLRRGRPDIAGAFKRMARMGLKSMKRWQRPSGEMWIVKNFAEPSKRLGFETYSFNSQYNLLPMAMLCIAYERANESIEERPLPSEFGTYVFDIHDPFTQVVAASGGYYVQIDTAADAHYGATGLQRVHRRGVELSPLTDSAAEHRAIGPGTDDVRVALSPGTQWKAADGSWIGLCDFHRFEPPPRPAPGEKPVAEKLQRVVKSVQVKVSPADDRAIVNISYELAGPDAKIVEQRYVVSSEGVKCEQDVPDDGCKFVFPVLVNDGARDTKVEIADDELTITRLGGKLKLVGRNPTMRFSLVGPRIPTHNGDVQAAESKDAGDVVRWQIWLEPAPLK